MRQVIQRVVSALLGALVFSAAIAAVTSTSASAARTSFTQHSWAKDLLTRLGYPVTKNNVTSVLAWEYAEGGHFQNKASYNPLNTTTGKGRYPAINSVGVRAYPDYSTGMKETIATLRLGYYKTVRSDLAHSSRPAVTVAAVKSSPWGTWKGINPAPMLARAEHDVAAHPSWYQHGAAKKPSKPKKPAPKPAQPATSRNGKCESGEFCYYFHSKQYGFGSVSDFKGSVANYGTNPATCYVFKGKTAGKGKCIKNNAAAVWNRTGKTVRVYFNTGYKGKHQDIKPGFHGNLNSTLKNENASHKIITKSTKPAKPTKPTKPGGSRATRIHKMLALAKKQHFVEHNGNNITPYGKWYGANGSAWCAMFVSWVFAHSGNPLPALDTAKGFAWVPSGAQYAKNHGQLHRKPKVGDVFFLNEPGGVAWDHTGIVSKVYKNGTFDTVEGNWNDRVSHEHRNIHTQDLAFWSPIH